MDEYKERYILNDKDKQLVTSAIRLLQKTSRASFLKPSQLVSIGKALHVLTSLPDTTEDIELTIDLSGPKRWYGDHEIWHYWQVSIEPGYISISSGGHFYRQSTGGDSFTCMQWSAQPECEAVYSDYLNSLSIVDDAQSFEFEVEQMDLSQSGYAIQVVDEDNPLLCDDVSNSDEDHETEDDEFIQFCSPSEDKLDKFADFNKGKKRDETHDSPPSNCDLCKVDLGQRRYFIDGRLKNSLMWANMCSDCFFNSGEAIGWGTGQLYCHQIDNEWLLVGGFSPE